MHCGRDSRTKSIHSHICMLLQKLCPSARCIWTGSSVRIHIICHQYYTSHKVITFLGNRVFLHLLASLYVGTGKLAANGTEAEPISFRKLVGSTSVPSFHFSPEVWQARARNDRGSYRYATKATSVPLGGLSPVTN